MCKHFIQWFLKNVINFFIIAEDLTISFKFMKLEIFVVSKWHVHDNWMNILHIYRLLWKGRKRNKLNNPRYKRLDEKREYPKRTIFPACFFEAPRANLRNNFTRLKVEVQQLQVEWNSVIHLLNKFCPRDLKRHEEEIW